jgi:acetyl-CoA carboxylase carboxyltransferase component
MLRRAVNFILIPSDVRRFYEISDVLQSCVDQKIIQEHQKEQIEYEFRKYLTL